MCARIAFVLALLAALTGASLAGPAHAVSARPVVAQYVYHVPPITCESVNICELQYNSNGSLQGYWMARRPERPGFWVRLTKVAGWNNDQAAPITCLTEDSCVIDYYIPTHGELGYYWMARQASGTTWVRMTLIPGTGT